MLQQMDLYLSASDIGSCWQGQPAPTKTLQKSSKLKFIIFIAFGNTKNAVHRINTSEFERKSLQEITSIESADDLLETARLAPSARNSQPWFFTGDKNIIHAYYTKPNFIMKLFAGKYPPIDVGIALYHLKLAAEYFGKKNDFLKDKNASNNSIKGFEYVTSLKIMNEG